MIALALAACLALLGWLGIALARGGFWRTSERLPPARPGGPAPAVCAIVPARDEADLLPVSLPTLLAQDYPGPLSVVVVDDRSRDHTAEVAARLAEGAARELRVVRGEETPPRWAGKPWALQRGLEEVADTELVWLTDADIAHAPDVLRRLVATLFAGGRDLVSVMATLRTQGRWERLCVPAFVYFFALLYPFRRVAAGSSAAAAGGCMLVRRASLAAVGDFAAIRSALIDDVALARALRGRPPAGGRLWLGLSPDVRSVRPYRGLAPLWRMVRRSAYTQLRYSPLLLAATTAGLLLLFAVPPAAVLAGAAVRGWAGWLAAGAGAAGYLTQVLTYAPTVRLYALPAGYAAALPVAGLLYLAMTLDSAHQHRRGRTGRWREESVAASPRGGARQ